MQRSWRQDADKLTFIACRPISTKPGTPTALTPDDDAPANMVGDINLFLRVDDGEDGDAPPAIVGEIELMIAEKANQRKGFGKAALLTFIRYIVEWQGLILEEFVSGGCGGVESDTVRKVRCSGPSLSCLSVKIGQENERSLALFEGLGFVKVSERPSFFGEFELRRGDLRRESVDLALREAGVEEYVEVAL